MANELRLVIVTPETTLVDVEASAVQIPMYDGQLGVLPGRAPMVGRLGYGELRLTTTDGSASSYFIDGGFVQIKGTVVSVLTDRSMPVDEIAGDEASDELQSAIASRAVTDEEFETRDRDIERARRMVALARKPR